MSHLNLLKTLKVLFYAYNIFIDTLSLKPVILSLKLDPQRSLQKG